MRKLLRIELLKYISYTNFWVVIGLHAGLFILASIFITQIRIDVPGFDAQNIFGFPNSWNVYTWLASWFNILLTILLITITGNEFSFRTFRQNVIDGLSRKDLLTGKLIVVFLTALYCLVLVFLTTTVFGLFMTKEFSISGYFNKFYYLLVYFIQMLAYMSIGLFVVVLAKNIALSILYFFLYFIPIEPIIRAFLPDYISSFFPMKVISNLTPMPDFIDFSGQAQFTSSVNGQIVTQQPVVAFELPLYVNVLLAIFYSALFISLTYYILKKRNL